MRDLTYQAIKNDILSCELAPGQKLSEAILAKTYGASRSLIREVLVALEFEKLIVVIPRIGSFVAAVSFDYLAEALFVRKSLEVSNLRDLVLPMLDSQMELLEIEVAKAEILLNLNQYEDFLESTNTFHKMLFSLTGRNNIWDYIKIFNNSIHVLHHVEKSDQESRSQRLHAQHKELIIHLRNCDVESAITLMIDHISIDFQDMHIVSRDATTNRPGF